MITRATFFACIGLVLWLVAGCGGSERCKVNTALTCYNYLYCCCSYNRQYEYCCADRSRSVWQFPCPVTTTTPKPIIPPTSHDESWWDSNSWWVSTGIRILIPACFFLIGGIVIGILICTGKIKLSRVFGRSHPPNRRPQVMVSTTSTVVSANQPPSYMQATGGSYPVQPTTNQTFSVQPPPYQPPEVATGSYPVQPSAYTVPPGGSYPTQQYSNAYPPMENNPNYTTMQDTQANK